LKRPIMHLLKSLMWESFKPDGYGDEGKRIEGIGFIVG
jgi:hypothetical protein